MDVLVHLSLREGLPRAVVQALASCKPAVGFNLDGTPEVIIDGKTGFTADAENIEQVICALKKLLSSPDLCYEMGIFFCTCYSVLAKSASIIER